MWVLKWGQPGLTKKLHDLMAPRGKFKYSSALQLASYSTAWHEFIHKHLNPGWVWLWGASQWANMMCQHRRVHLLMHIFAYNQWFHSREIMSVGHGDRAVCVCVRLWGEVLSPASPLGGGTIPESWRLVIQKHLICEHSRLYKCFMNTKIQ